MKRKDTMLKAGAVLFWIAISLFVSFQMFGQGTNVVHMSPRPSFAVAAGGGGSTASIDTFQINWTQSGTEPAGWVNIINNVTTAYNIDGNMDITAQGSYPGGSSGDTGGTSVPDDVASTYHWGDGIEWVIDSISSVYDSVAISIFASRGGTSDDRSGDYIFEVNDTITFNAAQNTDTWIEFDYIAVPADNEILIKLDQPAGSVAAYINGAYLRLKDNDGG